MATRKRYTRAFKPDTVTLVTEPGISRTHVAREMGIDIQTLRTSIKQVTADGAHAFPGSGHPRDEARAHLRREHDQLRQERDILKKALGIFSRMPE